MQAFESIYDLYAPLALGLATRMLSDRAAAEDVVQEAFVSMWRRADSYDPTRGSLRVWLLAIVRNRAIDRLRQAAKAQPLASPPASPSAEDRDALDAVVLDMERKELREAFRSLPQAQRETIELAYFGGLKHVEIAQRMRVPLGTVKGRMRIGLEKLRSFLQARGLVE